MGAERCYWRDIELLRADLRSRWDERMVELIRSGGHPPLPNLLGMAGPNNAPSLHSGLPSGLGPFAPNADVQIFTPVICAQSQAPATAGEDMFDAWVKPPGVTFVRVFIMGPGGGAGSGRKGSTTTVCCAGGAGGSGSFTMGEFFAADLQPEVPLYVPAGGAGGAGIAANDTNGNAGAGSRSALFGSSAATGWTAGTGFPIIGAGAGGAGAGGTASAGSGGGGGGGPSTWNGFNGGSASATGAGGGGGSGSAGMTSAGGGTGGGLTSANAQSAGGGNGPAGMWNNIYTNLSGGGGAGGGNGAHGSNPLLQMALGLAGMWVPATQALPSWGFFMPSGGGAGGGSSNTATAAGNGGNGLWGGGAGSGGAATDTTTPRSGAGGNGGDAFIIVVAF